MRKSFVLLLLLLLGLSSCVFNEYDEMVLADWFKDLLLIVGITFVVMIVLIIVITDSDTKRLRAAMSKKGDSIFNYKYIGSYVGGHPKCDIEISRILYKNLDDEFRFYQQKDPSSIPAFRFDIQKRSISSISIEDATSIEKKITLGRVILVGIFALAWKKKKKNEISFLVIDWNDGRFDHSTTFVVEGKNAMQTANTYRNMLIRNIDSKI